MEPFIKDGLLANEYYNHLIEQNAPETQEIKDYYAENVQNFDRVDYHSFSFPANAGADASEEDLNKAMADAKNKTDAMMEARKRGEPDLRNFVMRMLRKKIKLFMKMRRQTLL